MEIPDSPGHWALQDGDDITYWDVAIRQDWPKRGMSHPFAFNADQHDPCGWLTGDWRKVSDENQGGLKNEITT